MERLQKVIAHSGYCSRRKAEEEIKAGNVSVNGKVITELGTQISPNDYIVINGVSLRSEDKEYILVNKPRGVITTTSDDKERKTVLDLVKTNKRLYPVGRLDFDTTGALILTNDGELTNLLTHPKNEVEKVYIAKIKGIIKGESIKKLENGIEADGVKYDKARVKLRSLDKSKQTSIVEITIHEGKNHQVKKMLLTVGHPVLKLKREKIAFLDVKSLKSGEYRYLLPKEVKKLYNEANKKKITLQ